MNITSISKLVPALACALVVAACAVESEQPEEQTLTIDSELRNDDYTTRTVCTDCGCKATMVACNCGMPPSKKKLECIRNGGPDKVMAPVGVFVGASGSAETPRRAAP